MSPGRLKQLKTDIKAAGYTLKKVTPRVWDTVLQVTTGDIVTLNDRENIVAIVKANGLRWDGSSIVGDSPKRVLTVIVKNAT